MLLNKRITFQYKRIYLLHCIITVFFKVKKNMKKPGSVIHSFHRNTNLSQHGLWPLHNMILLSLVKVCKVYHQLSTQMKFRSGCFSTEAIWDQWGHALSALPAEISQRIILVILLASHPLVEN